MFTDASQLPDPAKLMTRPSYHSKANVESLLRLNDNQCAMLFRCADPNNRDVGLMNVRFDITGSLDIGRWKLAWQRCIAQQQMLRATIHSSPTSEPKLVIWKQLPFPHEHFDLTFISRARQPFEIQRQVNRHFEAISDLDCGPNHRILLFKLAKDRHAVRWLHHHIFLDGISSQMILHQVLNELNERPHCKTSSPSLEQFTRALFERPREESKSYWSSRLRTTQPTLVCVPDEIPVRDETRSRMRFSESQVAAIEASLESRQCQPSAIILAAWSNAIGQLTRQTDIAFGLSVSGRPAEISGANDVAGYFSKVVPCTIRLEEQTADELIQHFRDDQFESQHHHGLPTEDIFASSPYGDQLFDSCLIIQKAPFQLKDESQIRFENYRSGMTSNFGLTCNVVTGKRWELELVSRRSLKLGMTLDSLADLLAQSIVDLESILDPKAITHPGVIVSAKSETIQEPRILAFKPIDNQTTSKTQIELLKIWQQVFPGIQIRATDNFFSMGGKSLTAVRLIRMVNQHFGATLQPSILLDSPTIEQLAGRIENGKSADQFINLVPVSVHERVNLFCVHGGDGFVMFYREFAKQLAESCSTFGLQPFGLYGKRKPLESIHDMAAAYLKEVTAFQPYGPVHLLGHCSGGLIAFEMAKQLQQAGREPGLLFVVDGEGPGTGNGSSSRKFKFDWAYQLRKLRRTLRYAAAKLSGNRDWQQELHVKRVWNATGKAVREYQNRLVNRLESKSTLVIGNDFQQHSVRPEDWLAAVNQLEIVKMDCLHADFFEPPYVEEVAKTVRDGLAQFARTSNGERLVSRAA